MNTNPVRPVVKSLALLLTMVLSSCFCEHEVRETQFSPSRSKVAEVIVKRCGAIAGEDTVVTLRNTRQIFAKTAVVVAVDDFVSVGVSWKNETTLVVSLPRSAFGSNFADSKVGVQRSKLDDVEVEYQLF